MINALKQEIKSLEDTITALERDGVKVSDECLGERAPSFSADVSTSKISSSLSASESVVAQVSNVFLRYRLNLPYKKERTR